MLSHDNVSFTLFLQCAKEITLTGSHRTRTYDCTYVAVCFRSPLMQELLTELMGN